MTFVCGTRSMRGLFRVPSLPVHGGRWQFRIAQRYQQLDVSASAAEARGGLVVPASQLRGTQITLVVEGIVGRRAYRHVFSGELQDDRIAGEVLVSDGNAQRRYPWSARR